MSATSFLQLIRLAQFARNQAYVVAVGLLPVARGTVWAFTPHREPFTRRMRYANITANPHSGTN